MAVYELRKESFVNKPISEVFDFFSKAENLEKLTPSWLGFRILTPLPIQMKSGAIITYQISLRGIPMRWLTEIERWNPPYEFVDIQISGPYKLWRHTHRFHKSNGGTAIEDIVEYELPFGPLGRIAHWVLVKRDLEKIFCYREQQVRKLIG